VGLRSADPDVLNNTRTTIGNAPPRIGTVFPSWLSWGACPPSSRSDGTVELGVIELVQLADRAGVRAGLPGDDRQLTWDQRPMGRPNAVHYILGVADGSSPLPGEEVWEDIGSLRLVSKPKK
jgi:hypothetical protein